MGQISGLRLGKPCLDVLHGHETFHPPIWLMRQAGRYLSEYRQIREKAGSFLDLCYRPELAAEVTLQPIRRFGFDAAILFADILLVAQSLGQDLTFVEGEGPRLAPLMTPDKLPLLSLARSAEILAPVAKTVRLVKQSLPKETTLIGFAGAPWTVATYMVAGQGTNDQAPARLMAYRERESFKRLIDLIVEATIAYLLSQIEAGAEVVQIFDSWAGSLPKAEFEAWVIEPTKRIVERLKQAAPEIPVIGFARGAGGLHAAYGLGTGVGALGIETQLPLGSMADLSELGFVVQGNLDPLLVIAGGKAMEQGIREIKSALRGRRHIFNLGHGILPETPIGNVQRLVDLVRQ